MTTNAAAATTVTVTAMAKTLVLMSCPTPLSWSRPVFRHQLFLQLVLDRPDISSHLVVAVAILMGVPMNEIGGENDKAE